MSSELPPQGDKQLALQLSEQLAHNEQLNRQLLLSQNLLQIYQQATQPGVNIERFMELVTVFLKETLGAERFSLIRDLENGDIMEFYVADSEHVEFRPFVESFYPDTLRVSNTEGMFIDANSGDELPSFLVDMFPIDIKNALIMPVIESGRVTGYIYICNIQDRSVLSLNHISEAISTIQSLASVVFSRNLAADLLAREYYRNEDTFNSILDPAFRYSINGELLAVNAAAIVYANKLGEYIEGYGTGEGMLPGGDLYMQRLFDRFPDIVRLQSKIDLLNIELVNATGREDIERIESDIEANTRKLMDLKRLEIEFNLLGRKRYFVIEVSPLKDHNYGRIRVFTCILRENTQDVLDAMLASVSESFVGLESTHGMEDEIRSGMQKLADAFGFKSLAVVRYDKGNTGSLVTKEGGFHGLVSLASEEAPKFLRRSDVPSLDTLLQDGKFIDLVERGMIIECDIDYAENKVFIIPAEKNGKKYFVICEPRDISQGMVLDEVSIRALERFGVTISKAQDHIRTMRQREVLTRKLQSTLEKAERLIRSQRIQLAIGNEILRSPHLSAKEISRDALRKLREEVLTNGAEISNIVLMGDEKVEIFATDMAEGFSTDSLRGRGGCLDPEGELVGTIREEGQTVTIDLDSYDGEVPPLFETFMKQGIKTVIMAPLYAQGSFVGILTLGSVSRRDSISAEDYYNIDAIGQYLAMGINMRRYSEELERLVDQRSKQLREALKSLEGFVSHVSHELRTPITTIGTTAYLTKRLFERDLDPNEYPQLAEKINALQGHVELFKEIIEDLEMLSRLERGIIPLEASDVRASEIACTAVQNNSKAAAEKDISLFVTYGDGAENMTFEVDQRLILQSLKVIIENAIKFSPEGSEIIIRVEFIPNPRIIIRDQGPGIFNGEEELIFGAFEQGSLGKQVGGTGLGLSITKKIIDLHGGSVSARNRTDGTVGAEFTIEFRN